MGRKIRLENYDDGVTVHDEQYYEWLSQFKWYIHLPSKGQVVAYVDYPDAGTYIVFFGLVVLCLNGSLHRGENRFPLHPTTASGSNEIGLFISKQDFERYTRRRI